MLKHLLVFIMLITSIFSKDKQENYSIKEFKLEKYLGTWYEILRKDNIFEKDLDFVTITYSLLPDGKIDVLNKGFNIIKNKDNELKGKIRQKYQGVENILETNFLGPFYSDYIILDYDKENYTYALLMGSGENDLWILSKQPKMNDELINKLLKVAENNGVKIENLIYVRQNKKIEK